VLVPGSAMAAPNIMGQSGYLYTPDGNVLGSGCVSVGYHHAKGDPQIFLRPAAGGGVRAAVVTPNVNSYHLSVGAFNHLELGLTAFNTGEDGVVRISPNTITTEGGTSYLANAKVALFKPTSNIQLVGGVVDGFDTIQRSGYGYLSLNAGSYMGNVPVVSTFAKKLQVGAGYGFGYIDGVFANGSVSLGPNIELMAEWLDNDLEGVSSGIEGYQYNIGGRFRTGKSLPGLAIDIGVTNLGGSAEMAYGLSWTYCPQKHHKKTDDGGDDGGDEKGKGGSKASALSPAGSAPARSAGLFRTPR
jgi:hypothetical protein